MLGGTVDVTEVAKAVVSGLALYGSAFVLARGGREFGRDFGATAAETLHCSMPHHNADKCQHCRRAKANST